MEVGQDHHDMEEIQAGTEQNEMEQEVPISSSSVSRMLYNRRYMNVAWKKVRKFNEPKYSFSKSFMRRVRRSSSSRSFSSANVKRRSSKRNKSSNITKNFNVDRSLQVTKDLPEGISEVVTNPIDDNDVGISPSDMDSEPKDETVTVDASSHHIIKMSKLDIYLYELKCNQAFGVVNSTLREFVLQDYMPEENVLKSHQYCFVSRVGKSFSGVPSWIYWCSCDRQRAEFIDSLSSQLQITNEELESLYSECLHIEAVRTIAETDIDGVFGISPEYDLSNDSYYVPCKSEDKGSCHLFPIGSEGAVCVQTEGGNKPGVVYCTDRSISCTVCKHQRHSCSHIKQLCDYISNEITVPEFLQRFADITASTSSVSCEAKPIYKLLSRRKIPFSTTSELANILTTPLSERFCMVDGICYLQENSSDSVCTLCGQALWEDTVSESVVITHNQTFLAKVITKRCASHGCNGMLEIDGQPLGLLCTNTFCITYEVLRQHMHQFLNGRTTIYTQYTVLCQNHIDTGDTQIKTHLSYNQYLHAWYSFVQLLDIDYNKGYTCSMCGVHPDVVIMDATSLAFRKDLDFWQPSLHLGGDLQQAPVNTKSTFSQRIMIPDQQARKLLRKFALKELDETDMDLLTSKLQMTTPALLAIVKTATVNHKTRFCCQHEWKEFLRSMSTGSPICASIHPSDRSTQLIRKLIQEDEDITKDATTMKDLQEEIPVLFELVRLLHTYPSKLLSPLLQSLLQKSVVPFTTQPYPYPKLPSSATSVCDEESLSFFPCLPVVRSRPVYSADKKSSPKQQICTKRTSKNRSLLPGVFTIFCEHGICYGFKVMRVSESPNTPFTVLLERFPVAPSTIIYDNACNLHQYMLNREPHFFKKSWLLVDRFHWPNHTGCTVGYKLDAYPQFATINSQTVEQANAYIKRIKASLSYMNAKNFMMNLQFYMWYRNSTKT